MAVAVRVGPHGYSHGWIKAGEEGGADLALRAANAARAKTGALKRGRRQNMSVGGGLAVAGGSSDIERPIADALTRAARTGKAHYVMPAATAGHIKVAPTGEVTDHRRASSAEPYRKVATLSDHAVAAILDRHLSARAREPAPPRQPARRNPDARPRAVVYRLVRDIQDTPALQRPEFYARAIEVAAASGHADLIPPEWTMAATASRAGFDPGKHPRIPGGHGGGEFAHATAGAGVMTETAPAGVHLVVASAERFTAAFGAAFAGSPYAAFVNHYTTADIRAAGMKPLLAAGGQAGLLVHDHGDGRVEATSLFNTSGQRGMGLALLRAAVRDHGVNYVECFGPALPKLYGTLGFADDQAFPFDPAQAPPGWDYARFDNPPYHTMRLAPGTARRAELPLPDLSAVQAEAERADPAWWAKYGAQAWQAALVVAGIDPPSPGEVRRARFDPGKHPRGYHGRWAHLPGGLPFSRSGNVVSYHGSLGIDRKDMPQLSGLVGGQYVPTAHMMPKFLDYLRSRGIAAQHTTIPAAKLRPAQTTGDHQAIRGIADQLKSGAYPGKRITVSQDGRVIDGHHNWAGLLLANSEGHPGEQKVLQVGLPARELLAEMRAFAKREGIASRKAGEMANPEFASRTAMVVPGAEELVEALAAGRWPGAARDSAPGAAGGTAGEEDGDGPEGRTGAPAVARGLTWDPAESVLGRAFNPREPRGPHGHWAKSPGPSQPPAAAPAMTPEQVTITEGIARAEARVAALEQARQLSEQQAADMHRMYGEMQRLTAKLKRETVAEAELQQRERKRARSKLLVHMGAIVAGIVLGGVEAKLGTPDLVSIASGGAPLAVQEITDWAKEL